MQGRHARRRTRTRPGLVWLQLAAVCAGGLAADKLVPTWAAGPALLVAAGLAVAAVALVSFAYGATAVLWREHHRPPRAPHPQHSGVTVLLQPGANYDEDGYLRPMYLCPHHDLCRPDIPCQPWCPKYKYMAPISAGEGWALDLERARALTIQQLGKAGRP